MNTRPQWRIKAAGTALVILTGIIGQGCAGRHAVIASTGTVLGLDISENPQTQLYHVKFGYNRGELAIVPSNRSAEKNATETNSKDKGALDTADVMMELRYGGFGIKSSGGIYQRLAVGTTAVKQPGAALMMAKNAEGSIDTETAKTISAEQAKVTAAVDTNLTAQDRRIDEILDFVTDPANATTLDPAKVRILVANTPLAPHEATIIGYTPEAFKLKLQRSWDGYVKRLNNNIP